MIQYIRSTILPSKPAQLLIQSGSKWNQDHCPDIAAALSYYALFSLFSVLGNALLLLVSLFSNIFIHSILQLIAALRGTSLLQVDELHLTKQLQFSSSFLILAMAGCILFKILPLVYVGWGDVWLSALLTALVLTVLQHLVSNSVITIGSRFLSYGVIGSVMILMLWIFLTCEIFLFGCVLSYVYAHLFGTRRGRAMEKLR